MTFSNPGRLTLEGDGDQAIELETDERYSPPSEITWLLKSLDYWKVEAFGARLEAYSGEDRL